jgi:hypothetical protein
MAILVTGIAGRLGEALLNVDVLRAIVTVAVTNVSATQAPGQQT